MTGPDALRRAKATRGLTLRQFALVLGCSHGTLESWLYAEHRDPPEHIALMALVLGDDDCPQRLLKRCEAARVALPERRGRPRKDATG